MPYPAALGQRPLEVDEAYAALQQYVADYGRSALLLMMHAAVPETLRADLLHLIRVNFLSDLDGDTSLEADVLFGPLTRSEHGTGYYCIDPQVRWHCLGLLQSLYRNEARPRALRVAGLLWHYVSAREATATREADPQLAEYLAIQRWVALAHLEPKNAARAFALALHQASQGANQTRLRLGGLASAIELPLAGEQELLTYAQGLDALVRGDESRAAELLGALGDKELRISDVVLKGGATLLREKAPGAPNRTSAAATAEESVQGSVASAEDDSARGHLVLPSGSHQLVVGRDALVREVSSAVLEVDVTVLVGTAGIGKMTVARAVAENLRAHFSAGTLFVDSEAVLPNLTPASNRLIVVELRRASSDRAIQWALRSGGKVLVTTRSRVHQELARGSLPALTVHIDVPGLSIAEAHELLGDYWPWPRGVDAPRAELVSPALDGNPLALHLLQRLWQVERRGADRPVPELEALVASSLAHCSPPALRLLQAWPSEGRFAPKSEFMDTQRVSLDALYELGLIRESPDYIELHPIVRALAQASNIAPTPRPRVLLVAPSDCSQLANELNVSLHFDRVIVSDTRQLFDRNPLADYSRVVVMFGMEERDLSKFWVDGIGKANKECIGLLVAGEPPKAGQVRYWFDLRDLSARTAQVTQLSRRLAQPVEREGRLFDVPEPPRDAPDTRAAEHVVRSQLLGRGGKRHVAIWGVPGGGKYALTIRLAHDPEVRRAFPDGIVMLRRQRKSTASVRQELERWAHQQNISWHTGARVLVLLDRPTTVREVEEALTRMDHASALLVNAVTEDVVAAIPERIHISPPGASPTQVRLLSTADINAVPRIYVSYSWDSPEYKAQVAAFARRLRDDGFNVHLDQFYSDSEFGLIAPTDWDTWQREQIRRADVMLLLCSETYALKIQKLEWSGSAKDVRLMRERFAHGAPVTSFVPGSVEPAERQSRWVPDFLAEQPYYDLSQREGYAALLQRLRPRRPRLVVVDFNEAERQWFDEFRSALDAANVSADLWCIPNVRTPDGGRLNGGQLRDWANELEKVLGIASTIVCLATSRAVDSLTYVDKRLKEHRGLRAIVVPVDGTFPTERDGWQTLTTTGTPISRLPDQARRTAWIQVAQHLASVLHGLTTSAP
jgi:hypothetical protein